MVLESIIQPADAELHPRRLIFIGALYTLFAMLFSIWIFPTYASLISVFILGILVLPFYHGTIKLEEQKDLSEHNEKKLLFEHAKAVRVLTNLFVGTMIVFALLYLILPHTIAQDAYAIQIRTITEFNNHATSQLTGAAVSGFDVFGLIFVNNLKVLFLSFFISIITGSGLLLILFWNSSVMGAALGLFIQEKTVVNGGGTFLTYLIHGLLGFLRYSLHGIPEILAYIIAGFAGALLSYAITTRLYKTEAFDTVLKDVLDLCLISIGTLFLAGIIEVYITPIFY